LFYALSGRLLLTKSKLKQYQQLATKKFRQKYGLFVVEGYKSVNELIQSSWPVEAVLCSPAFLENNPQPGFVYTEVSNQELNKISSLKTSPGIAAIAKMQNLEVTPTNWMLALESINDPGNLGTIIRIADWYGINTIFCSSDCVDMFNPKVIQATMGSFLRLRIIYGDLGSLLKNKQVYAATLNGKDLRTLHDVKPGVILIGSESNGLSPALLKETTPLEVTIPRAGKAESLNAAIATAIFCERLSTLSVK
jgi:TrmH family RNA methyltransferase